MNGLVLHKYYFGNLASGSELSPGSNLADDVGTAWRAGFHPVLVLDVFEHAFMGDYGASGRADYIAAFLENVNREVVEQRHKDSKAGRFTARF
jgi:Iron/manganese superoxide dismutases, C-terminal domain